MKLFFRLSIIILSILVVGIIAITFIYFYLQTPIPANKIAATELAEQSAVKQEEKPYILKVPAGKEISAVAFELEEKGLIRSADIFYLKARLEKLEIKAGRYSIKSTMNMSDIFALLKSGKQDHISVSIPEGLTASKIAKLLFDSDVILSKEDFLKEVSNSELLQKYKIPASSFEGYLFPDTYFFNKDIEKEELLETLTDNFNSKTRDILSDENLSKVGLTKEQAVIFASMVEREVRVKEDRPVVAGILIKRWKEGMKLDVDATTQYSVAKKRLCKGENYCVPNLEDIYEFQWWQNNLTREELDTEHPYNTRALVGLPPTPISSVSLSSLSSVINYESTPYYFYLTDKDGVTHYAKNITEHNQNVAKYLSN